MNMKRPAGLGRNLSALLGTPPGQAVTKNVSQGTQTLSIELLMPGKYQPRRTFVEESLQELAHSIEKQGLLQPILVRQSNEKFEILAGERRWRACQLAGVKEVPVVVKVVSDEEAMVIALIENLQREDLNILEQARGMQRLMQEFSLTHQQVAEVLSLSRSTVSNVIRLLSLSSAVQSYLEQGELDMGHARALLMLDEQQQLEVAQEIINKKLSVRATESLVKSINTPKTTPVKTTTDALLSFQAHQQNLISLLKTKVEIRPSSHSGAGKLVIHYESEEKLDNIVASLLT